MRMETAFCHLMQGASRGKGIQVFQIFFFFYLNCRSIAYFIKYEESVTNASLLKPCFACAAIQAHQYSV